MPESWTCFNEDDMYLLLKKSHLAVAASSRVSETGRTMTKDVTFINQNGMDLKNMAQKETVGILKYPVELLGSETGSREAKVQPKQKERCETPSENVGDGD